ncbi:MAG: two pore domain potassium channel family protein [Mycoplasmatales bacterium]|nr:two pore domain potassium channel family protein [Mycoplasmatales bacterium]
MAVRSQKTKKQKKVWEWKKDLNAIIAPDRTRVSKKIKPRTLKIYTYIYSIIILVTTLVSLSMLAMSKEYQTDNKTFLSFIGIFVFVVLSIDVFLRWYTADVRINRGKWSYLIFPLSLTGALLIISLLPSLYFINLWSGKEIGIFNTFRNMKFLRIFRLILLVNLVPSLGIFKKVLQKEKSTLYVVFSIVIIAIIVFALIMYNIESIDSSSAQKKAIELYNSNHETIIAVSRENAFDFNTSGLTKNEFSELTGYIKIHSFLDSIYFSTVALTTIGFGDISPITTSGKIIVMFMSIIGIAILATPSGVIAGGFISEIKEVKKHKREKKL